MTLNAS